MVIGNDSTSINTGGGSINMTNSAVGKGNVDKKNQAAISNSFNQSAPSNDSDFASLLYQIKAELEKTNDLPKHESKDLKYHVESAIEAAEEEPPEKERVISQLNTVQKILDTLKNSTVSALNLGTIVSKVLATASDFL